MNAPHLVLASHGTSSPLGQAAVAQLVASVAEALPRVSVLGCHVDVQDPDVATTLDRIADDSAAIVVPLLLSAGFHVYVDLAEAVADVRSRIPAAATPALGPDVRLAVLLARRLAEVGLTRADSVVLAAAGSTDPRAVADCERMRRLLAAEIANPVTLGFVSAAHPELGSAVDAARRELRPRGRVIVANYLLAPGHFSDRVEAAGGDRTTRPLLDGEAAASELVEIVVDRYLDQRRSWSFSIVPAGVRAESAPEGLPATAHR
ncbi:sirohydrochlorin chelatase [Herbiconiux liukaitaii]|uniref:sirohydrochlorin chelatase n=1 Tax=Herbiconiux liukaitaii TaxID=3342799 RepID=UPI0035B95B3D